MPTSHRTKWIVWSIVTVLVITVAWLTHGFFSAWNRFTNEERFCGAFHSVISAIGEFQEQTGSLPTNLNQLVPHYLPRIPSAPIVETIEYRVLPDPNWQLSVQSKITGTSELYVKRSSGYFTAEERQQSVTGFHGWLVFRDK